MPSKNQWKEIAIGLMVLLAVIVVLQITLPFVMADFWANFAP